MGENMRRIVLARRPEGFPVAADFRLEEVPMPEVTDGKVLVKVSHFSLDPYMRGRMDYVRSYTVPQALDETMGGGAVGTVVASKDPDYKEGDKVFGMFGWASHGCLYGSQLRKLSDYLPPSTALGVLGMPGFTAWSGLRAYGEMQPGQTLAVAAATGPVGSMVGQLARYAGMRTVGIAGGVRKCGLALQVFGFDACVDHHASDNPLEMMQAMHEACPEGIDIYFENVGGKVLGGVMPLLNIHARVIICGMIAWYSGETDETGQTALQKVWRLALHKRLKIQGLLQTDHTHLFDQFVEEVGPKVRDGEITYLEDVSVGLDSAPQAFFSMLRGGNKGKQVVKLE